MDVSNTSNKKKLLQATCFSEVDILAYLFNNIFLRWDSCFVIFLDNISLKIYRHDAKNIISFKHFIARLRVKTYKTATISIRDSLPSSIISLYWITMFNWPTLFEIHKRKCGRWHKEKSHVIQEMQYGHNASKTQGLGTYICKKYELFSGLFIT